MRDPAMLDVLLVNPYVLARHAARVASYRPYPPLGLMYLAAVLREAGFTVEIHDATFADGPEQLVQRLKTGEKPRVAGVYAMSSFRDDAVKAIELLKERGITVLAGGPDPSIYDSDYLDAGADLVVRGEGEHAILELLAAAEMVPGGTESPKRPADDVLASIPGVSFVDRDVRPRRAPDRPASKTMDDLPVPAYDLVDVDRYVREWRRVHGYASIQFMTSRGCPFSCTWCARPIFGRRYRQYSAQRAVDEIEFLVKRYGIEHLWLFDDTFVVRREWVEELCDALIARKLKVRWECLARTDLVDFELLRKMRDAGCERINFGFESGSQRILDAMKKGTNVVDARRVAKEMHQLGITMGGYVLFGYPGEEWEDIEATIQLVKDIAPVDYSVSVALPMPGTEFHELVHDAMLKGDWASRDPDSVQWESPYSPGFYRIVESLLHAEYELALEWSAKKYAKARLLRSILAGMRAAGDGKERLVRYRDPRFAGWQGLRTPEKAARHRAGHAKKAAEQRASRARLEVVS
ncbi:B12-binding domain-containing radical SAM protein [Myxococcota bacterium]|nr:B12-binding domain-containing radical SAM protein [Myxococcota bacterium]